VTLFLIGMLAGGVVTAFVATIVLAAIIRPEPPKRPRRYFEWDEEHA
jgi:gas vesicle protein